MKLLILLLSLALGACAQGPSEDVVKTAFEQSVRELPDSKDDFEILSIKKTDGKQGPNYLYFYEAQVRFPNGFRAHCLTDTCFKYVPLGVANNLEPQPAGTVVTFNGVLEFERRESGWIPIQGHLPSVVSVSQSGASAAPADSTPAHEGGAVGRPGQRGPLVRVVSASGGDCGYTWEGNGVTEAQLLDRAGISLKSAVDSLGGPTKVTDANMPIVDFQVAAGDVPFRCLRTALATVEMSGYAKLRIDNPDSGAEPWAQPMIFEFAQAQPIQAPGTVSPVRNRVSLNASGTLDWNGERIDLSTLRQYADLSQQMNPRPLVVFQADERVTSASARSVLDVLWRSHSKDLEITAPSGGISPHMSALTSITEVQF